VGRNDSAENSEEIILKVPTSSARAALIRKLPRLDFKKLQERIYFDMAAANLAARD
jgi:hypothetical protein